MGQNEKKHTKIDYKQENPKSTVYCELQNFKDIRITKKYEVGEEMDINSLNERIEELCEVLANVKEAGEVRAFLEDLCTYKEVEQMALRAYAARLFLDGNTYAAIIEKTELSSATLSRISRCISHGSGGYKRVLGEKDE